MKKEALKSEIIYKLLLIPHLGTLSPKLDLNNFLKGIKTNKKI